MECLLQVEWNELDTLGSQTFVKRARNEAWFAGLDVVSRGYRQWSSSSIRC
jgi:hypothetical protein